MFYTNVTTCIIALSFLRANLFRTSSRLTFMAIKARSLNWISPVELRNNFFLIDLRRRQKKVLFLPTT